jgi:hypothetical protein
MHPALVKVRHIAGIAADNGWKGKIDSEVIDGQRITTLAAMRNDESISMQYKNNEMTDADYYIFDKLMSLQSASQVIEKIQGWPDILKLFKWFPNSNRPLLVEKYRRLPFDWETDDPNAIMDTMMGRKLFWYSHLSNKIHTDIVLEKQPNKQSNKFEIRPVGHRKMFNFVGVLGFRSVLLDTILKVG